MAGPLPLRSSMAAAGVAVAEAAAMEETGVEGTGVDVGSVPPQAAKNVHAIIVSRRCDLMFAFFFFSF